MNEMNPQESLPEELLSAYLDGELPSDERVRVEAWLASNPEHRRLFDDLQAIRRELQALPQQALDASFSDRVLATIRLRNGDLAKSAGENKQDNPAPTQRSLGMPAWRWFAAGVAASLAAVFMGANFAPEALARVGLVAVVTQEVAVVDAIKSPEMPAAESLREAPQLQATDNAPAAMGLEQPSPEKEEYESGLVPGQQEARTPSENPSVDANLAKKSNAQQDHQRQLHEQKKEGRAESSPAPPAPSLALTEPPDAPQMKQDSDQLAGNKEDNADGSLPALSLVADREIAVSSHEAEQVLFLAIDAGPPQRAFHKDTVSDSASRGVQLSALELTGPAGEVEQLLRSAKVESALGLLSAPSAANAADEEKITEKEQLDQERALAAAAKRKNAIDPAAGARPDQPGAPGIADRAEKAAQPLAAGGMSRNSAMSADRARGASRATAKSLQSAAPPAVDSKSTVRHLRLRLIVVPHSAEIPQE